MEDGHVNILLDSMSVNPDGMRWNEGWNERWNEGWNGGWNGMEWARLYSESDLRLVYISQHNTETF